MGCTSDRLETGRLRVGNSRRRGQFDVAMVALRRLEDHDLVDPFEGQQWFGVGRVTRLGTAPTFGLLLGDRLGGIEGIGGGWYRGVGAVGA